MQKRAFIVSSLLAAVRAQQVGTLEAETHPSLTWQRCTGTGGTSCTNVNGKIVLDSNWRWVHNTAGYANCYDGNEWVAEHCPDPETCTANCALEGANYSGTYGITTSGNALTLKFVTTNSNGKNIGSRVYLMADDNKYEMFKLKNREFTFDAEMGQAVCGLNGAVYFISMDADGGLSRYPGNKAGAKYGTGYCDSQCPRDIKFIGGQANTVGWSPSEEDPNGGVGDMGTCCPEMDIWEANSISTAYTPHPCDNPRSTICHGDTCGGTYSAERYAGTCDPDGCDFNSFRQGNKTFYGPGASNTINSQQKVTVVTQFITHDGTDTGRLSEIKRFYVQNGRTIPNSQSTIPGIPGNSLTVDFCNVQKTVFGDDDIFTQHGDMAGMGDGMVDGMVLALSLWGDNYSHMLWLDSNYPTDADPNTPGVARGTCPTTSGDPDELEVNSPNAQVTYSNIKFGPIGSTFNQGSTGSSSSSSATTRTTTTTGTSRTTTTTPSTTTTTTPRTSTTTTSRPPTTTATNCAARWGQCGGRNWTGPTCCQSGSTCRAQNEWYSQCL